MIFKIVDGRSYFYQWDINRQIEVSDPTIKEVHFCNRTDVCSLVVEVVDGIANVPNLLLQSGFNIRVFGYDGQATLHEATFEVKARTKPTDYIYTETEIKQFSDLESRITEIEEKGISEEVITNAVNNYLDEHPINMEGYATEEYVNEAVSNVEVDLTDYATKAYVAEEVAKVSSGGDIDLSEYAKKEDIPDVSKFISAIPEEYITESELEAKGYAKASALNDKANTNHTHSEYAKTKHTHDMADVNGLQNALSDKATQADIDKAIELHNHDSKYAPIGHSHGDEYAAKSHVHSYNNLLDKPTIPSIEGLASESYVNAAIKNINIPSVEGLATKEYVDDAIANIEISSGEDGPTTPLYRHTVKVSASSHSLKPDSIFTAITTSEAPFIVSSLAEYITKNGGEIAISGTAYIEQSYRPIDYLGISGNNFVFKNQNKECTVAQSAVTISDKVVPLGVASVSEGGEAADLSNYYTKEEVNGLIPDVSNFADKEHTHKQYLTEHQSLANYYTKTEVDEAIANIDIPESGGGSAEGAVSYLEAQELTDEQKNTAKANLELPYIAAVMTDLATLTKSIANTANSYISLYVGSVDGKYPLQTIYNMPIGGRFFITATSPDKAFTEIAECEKTATSRFKILNSDSTILFTSSLLDLSTTSITIDKRDTTSVYGSTGDWTFTISYIESVYNNKLDGNFVDAAIISKAKYDPDYMIGFPSFIMRPSSDSYKINDGNIAIGSSISVQSSYGGFYLGKNISSPTNNSALLVAGQSLVVGYEDTSSTSPFTKAIMLGNNLRGGQNYNYSPLVIGSYNDRTSKYIPYKYSTTYNTGDFATAAFTNYTAGVWRSKTDDNKNHYPPSSASSNDYWEYVDNGATTEYLFTIGNGVSTSNRSNAFTVDAVGNVVAAGTVTPTGADYAEYFEFEDGNPNKEDRIGYLVELVGSKIKLANGTDILGATSGTKGVIGDAEEMNWHGKYENDEFGRPIFETIEVVKDIVMKEGKNGPEMQEVKEVITTRKISPKYDPNKNYVSRSDRPEWAPVGLLGKVLVRHDGTLSVGDYVKAINGIASRSEEKTNVRVLEVISENVIKVLIK